MREAFLLNADSDGIQVGGGYVFGSGAVISRPHVALESLLAVYAQLSIMRQ